MGVPGKSRDPDVSVRQGIEAHQSGQLARAQRHYEKALRIAPSHVAAMGMLGIVLAEQGKLKAGAWHLTKAVEIEPRNADLWFNLASVQLRLDDHSAAERSLRETLGLRPNDPGALGSLGVALHRLGAMTDAEESLRRAIALSPRDVAAFVNLGNLLLDLNRREEAVDMLGQARLLAPGDTQVLLNLANALLSLDRLTEPEALLRQVVQQEPANVRARASLIELLDKANRVEEMRSEIGAARDRLGNHVDLAFGEARLRFRDGDFEGACAHLRRCEADEREPTLAAGRLYLLGDALERLGHAAEAFKTYTRANTLMARSPAWASVSGARYRQHLSNVERVIDEAGPSSSGSHVATESDKGSLSSDGPGDDRVDPVFLVGFPRSGTTLLDTILRSHPGITVVEERPFLTSLWSRVDRDPDGTPGLGRLTPGHCHALRANYFEMLDQELGGPNSSHLVVDKMPLNMAETPLLWRLFPGARLVHAQRHPLDTVLSCFMRSFEPNDAMANFLDLRQAAALYDHVMRIWVRSQWMVGERTQTVRYESIVEDFDGTVRSLLAFLGVPWTESMRVFTETARLRPKVRTASFDQVIEPLYGRASGRWRAFESELEPIREVLDPWISRLGYEDDRSRA